MVFLVVDSAPSAALGCAERGRPVLPCAPLRLAVAARQPGLGNRDIQAALNSARKTTQHRFNLPAQHSAEAELK